MPTTTELLPTLNADVLKALARQLALPKTLTRKPELIEELDRYVRVHLSNLLAHYFVVDPPPVETDKYTEHGGAIRAHAWGVLVQQCEWARAKSGRLALTADGLKLLASMQVSEFAGGVEAFLFDDGLHHSRWPVPNLKIR